MKYLLKFLPYAGSLLFSFLTVKFSRYITSLLPFLSAFDSDNITDMICAIIPFFTGIMVEFFKIRREKELLKQEHKHQLAMQAKDFEDGQKQRDDAHKAVIAQMEADFALKLANQSLEWEREDKAREESEKQQRIRECHDAYTAMVNTVSEYINKHDVNYKTEAEKAIRNFRSHTKGILHDHVNGLLSVISRSYAFDGPDFRSVEDYLKLIEQHLPD